MASNMAEKKKNANPSRSASRSQTVEPKAASSAKETAKESKDVNNAKEAAKEEKAAGGVKATAKGTKEVSRDRERNKPVAKKAPVKAPATWRVRLRKYRLIAFLLDAYFELRHKVTWPTAIEARNMTIIVILLSAAVGVVLGLADLGLYQVFLLISHIGAPK